MLHKIKEIEACNYECEAGKLELNVAWQELKEKAERYEKALEEICSTSGKSMIHNFTVDGHKHAVLIAEKTLEE
jgi:hypothetical protein